MNINQMISIIKKRPDFGKIGMIASHLGVVRETSRNDQKVTGVEVAYDQEKLKSISDDIKRLSGIIEVLIETNEGHLNIGDDIMAVVVAGDIRENVFPALIKTVNRIKEDAVNKKEFFVES